MYVCLWVSPPDSRHDLRPSLLGPLCRRDLPELCFFHLCHAPRGLCPSAGLGVSIPCNSFTCCSSFWCLCSTCLSCSIHHLLLRLTFSSWYHRSHGDLAQKYRSPFSFMHLDLIGPLLYIHGFSYLLTMTDCTTPWSEVAPLSSISAKSCARAFLITWVVRFDVFPLSSCPTAGPSSPTLSVWSVSFPGDLSFNNYEFSSSE